MARTTKIPCEGVIYTVHEDAYGSIVETDEPAEIMADESDVTDEHARYAQVLTELDELEEALTEAETQASRAGHLGDREADEDENSLPLL
ncbi:MAG: hypothetical protein H0T92_04515 [Pyrinomonadaceae bacterium]|nr:hypothetical protein [Pyrinomonadaceae bacterium]